MTSCALLSKSRLSAFKVPSRQPLLRTPSQNTSQNPSSLLQRSTTPEIQWMSVSSELQVQLCMHKPHSYAHLAERIKCRSITVNLKPTDLIYNEQCWKQGNIWTKIRPQNCRVVIVLKHLGLCFVQMFVHIFALCMWGWGGLLAHFMCIMILKRMAIWEEFCNCNCTFPDFLFCPTTFLKIGQNVRQLGHFHGTNGTRPWGSRNPNGVVSHQNSWCLVFLLFPIGRPIFIQCECWEEICSLYEGAKLQPNTGSKSCPP